jgi:hypothetical protein
MSSDSWVDRETALEKRIEELETALKILAEQLRYYSLPLSDDEGWAIKLAREVK